MSNGPYEATYISTATTTTPWTGSGEIAGIMVENTLAGTVTIKDGADTLGVLPISAAVNYYPFPATIHVSLVIVTTQADKLTVFHRKRNT